MFTKSFLQVEHYIFTRTHTQLEAFLAKAQGHIESSTNSISENVPHKIKHYGLTGAQTRLTAVLHLKVCHLIANQYDILSWCHRCILTLKRFHTVHVECVFIWKLSFFVVHLNLDKLSAVKPFHWHAACARKHYYFNSNAIAFSQYPVHLFTTSESHLGGLSTEQQSMY